MLMLMRQWEQHKTNKAPSTRIRIFLNPQLFLSGYENIRVHTLCDHSVFISNSPVHTHSDSLRIHWGLRKLTHQALVRPGLTQNRRGRHCFRTRLSCFCRPKWVRSSASAYAYVAGVLTCVCLCYAYACAYAYALVRTSLNSDSGTWPTMTCLHFLLPSIRFMATAWVSWGCIFKIANKANEANQMWRVL